MCGAEAEVSCWSVVVVTGPGSGQGAYCWPATSGETTFATEPSHLAGIAALASFVFQPHGIVLGSLELI